jgi:hypothetical protein
VSDQAPAAQRHPAAIPTRMSQVRVHLTDMNGVDKQSDSAAARDPEQAADWLIRDLRSAPEGYFTRAAERRLPQYGPNTLRRQHHAYQQATTMTFLGMMAGQIGTAFAVRTQRASVRSVGVFTNRHLLAGIAAEIVLAAVFVYAPPMQALLGTAPLPVSDLLLLAYPVIVWGAYEFMRCVLRKRARA